MTPAIKGIYNSLEIFEKKKYFSSNYFRSKKILKAHKSRL